MWLQITSRKWYVPSRTEANPAKIQNSNAPPVSQMMVLSFNAASCAAWAHSQVVLSRELEPLRLAGSSPQTYTGRARRTMLSMDSIGGFLIEPTGSKPRIIHWKNES